MSATSPKTANHVAEIWLQRNKQQNHKSDAQERYNRWIANKRAD